MGSYGHMLCHNTYSAVIHPSGNSSVNFATLVATFPAREGKGKYVIASETSPGKADTLTLSAEFCRHVVQIVIDVLFHGERFGYIEVDRLLTVASDNAVGFTFH